MNRNVGTLALFISRQAEAEQHIDQPVDHRATQEAERRAADRANELGSKRHAAQARQSAFKPKIPHAMPPQSPQSPCSAQTPSTSSIFHLSVETENILTNTTPATRPVTKVRQAGASRQIRHIQRLGQPSAPLWTKPGSLRPATSAARIPPHIASSELTATRPETALRLCALITLKPNQPTHSIHEPIASHGIDDGGGLIGRPLVVAADAGAKWRTRRQAPPSHQRRERRSSRRSP